ncbi:tyrosine-type recombinase/integrase [Xanthobacter oligotrophicus]|uniref:Tyrosine-type recombinase/integrase n=1 Tax=Xanthobacter oligotrophicus TaxID=2607286 RepID=A0ABW6ZQ65_9HYPH
MGTIIPRQRKDGSTAYQAQIVVKRSGEIVHREQMTFDRRNAAVVWLEQREKALAVPGALEAARAPDPTLGEVIDRYVRESRREIGRTKAQVLNTIKGFPIAQKRCSQVTSPVIVEFAQAKLATGIQPQTMANYISHLAAIFTVAQPAWGYRLDKGAMDAAHVVLRRMGLTSRGRMRSRRPTLDEIDALMKHFGEVRRRRPSSADMQVVIAFALFSTRRLEEITRIAWEDLDEEGSRILVRDLKHPGEKIGNDVWCDLPGPALALVLSMPRGRGPIFPYSTDAIGAAFARACLFLTIEDLHFHDLRHEGVSRLFEMGKNIPHVAAVSGHRAWTSLKRYTHLRQVGDKWAGWPWLSRLTSARS